MTIGDTANVVELAGYLTILGLITWLVRRVFTHTIPRLAKSYEENLACIQDRLYNELKETREAFREELRSQREDFREQIKMERDSFCTQLDRMTSAISSLEAAVRDRR